MPSQVVYLGDELSAAGFRLAGVSARVPPEGEEALWLAAAMQEAEVVLLGIRCAAALSPSALVVALASRVPLVMVMPAFDGAPASSDPAVRVRRLLGVEA
jgi:vacuolar-type H+-ATPase subunit F/Vma7